MYTEPREIIDVRETRRITVMAPATPLCENKNRPYPRKGEPYPLAMLGACGFCRLAAGVKLLSSSLPRIGEDVRSFRHTFLLAPSLPYCNVPMEN